MFTNTDINTHIWFFDSEPSNKIKVIKADNTELFLFSAHHQPQDKMKNAYSETNIKEIVSLINNPKEIEFVCKNISLQDCCEINISNLVGSKKINEEVDIDSLEKEINKLLKELTFFESFA